MPTTVATIALCGMLALIPVAALGFQPAVNKQPATTTETTDAEPVGDPERGKVVYQRVGNCTYCHGWAGDGKHGKHPRSPGVAANLRESELDAAAMMEVVRCGIPGTAMPYHVAQAYKNPDLCFGLTMDDFDAGQKPERGKTFRENDVANVVAYIQETMRGKGEVTLEECESILKPGDTACDFLR
jgi:mono/diheme cytochrome c family protein